MTIPAQRRPIRAPWRVRLHEVIFEADTPAGRAFDIVLLVAILASVLAVMLESVAAIRRQWGRALDVVEWSITIAFTVEYVLRLLAVDRPWRYVRSFLGIVDFLAIVPTYLGILAPEAQSLIVIRTIRLLRVFRIFKLSPFLGEAEQLRQAIGASRRKITVFLGVIVTVMVMMGTVMYVVEGEAHGFTSIPRQHVLGGGDHDHRGLRRHRAEDAAGAIPGRAAHDPRLRHHRGPHRYRVGGAGPDVSSGVPAGVPGLRRRGARCRCHPL